VFLLRLCPLLIAALLLNTADPSWRGKPVAEWDADDAKQLLTESPWVKNATPERVRDMSPSERRDSGDWDENIGKGVGLAGIGLYGPARAREAIARAHEVPAIAAVQVRWESALSTRAAEQKAGETDTPVLDSDGYAIAVYGIALPHRRNLEHELKGLAMLKRYNKKDAKPSRVQIVRQEDERTATVVYLFPRSIEITKKDGGIDFIAQIGRLVVSQYFYTDEMQLEGELQVLMPATAIH
jgi:hypothetical protein